MQTTPVNSDRSLAWMQSVTSCRVGGLPSSGHAMG
jgi:hypothetical protein